MQCLYWVTIVQIILENFPVSSSSHVELLMRVLTKKNESDVFFSHSGINYLYNSLEMTAFVHWLHGPTIVMIALFFAPRWTLFLSRFQMMSASWYRLLGWVMIVDLITIIFFLLFTRCSFFLLLPTPWGLGVTAAALLSLRWCSVLSQKKIMDGRSAIALGCAQGVALLPGISRFGSTYVVARWLGYGNRAAFEISFLIEWPLLCIAFVQSVVTLHRAIPGQFLHLGLLLAMIAASIVAWYGLFLVQYLVRTNRMWWFSLYLPVPIILWFYMIG